jgi:two-component system phosphate regulon sensor histidine kinase PhoR
MKGKFLEAVVREMEMGVIVLSSDKKILYANPFIYASFPLKDGIEGKKITDIINDHALFKIIDKVFASEGSQSQEITIQGRGNQVLDVRLVPFPMELDSKVLIGFFQDVTEEKRVEAIKRDFVANVSHELRTPLASIKGYAETLLDGALDNKETLKKFLTIIDRHANRMTALIEDLLTLSKLESHQMPMSFEPLDVKGIISGVIQGFEKQVKDKGIEIVINVGDNLPKVMGDKGRLEQVIVNLVDNAIKYTNDGKVKVVAKKLDNVLKVDVEDTGIGIPEKDIPRIFERFYRVDKGRSRELGGTGLGLAIVKHIIQGHNGKIWVESQLGKGTTFSFTLPLS